MFICFPRTRALDIITISRRTDSSATIIDRRRHLMRGCLSRLKFFIILLAYLPSRGAHPSLVDPDKCGNTSHPTTRALGHAAPVVDNSLTFHMYFADVEESEGELMPDRAIPEVRKGRERSPANRSQSRCFHRCLTQNNAYKLKHAFYYVQPDAGVGNRCGGV